MAIVLKIQLCVSSMIAMPVQNIVPARMWFYNVNKSSRIEFASIYGVIAENLDIKCLTVI